MKNTMTLNEALTEFRKLKIADATAMALNSNRSSVEASTITFLRKVDESLIKFMNETTQDAFTACLLFYEMSVRKIGELAPLMAYYYGSKAMNQHTIPENSRMAARRIRLYAFFQNMDKFDRFVMLAKTPMIGYSGSLTDEEFFDFLIMSDVYHVWNSDRDSNILQSLQRQTIQNESKHPRFTKEKIKTEGEKVHRALFDAIEMACGPRS